MTRSCHPHHGVPPGRRAAVGARCRPGSGVRPAQPPAHPRLRRLRCRGDADFPQVTQKRDHRAPAQRPPAASRLPGRQKRRHRVLVELNRFQPRARHPHADLAQILQHVPHRRGRVASIRQPRPVALDLRTQPAFLLVPDIAIAHSPPSRTTVPLTRGCPQLTPQLCRYQQRAGMPEAHPHQATAQQAAAHVGIVTRSA